MIYFDHHSTTPVAPEVVAAMLPLMQTEFYNAGSITHAGGRSVAQKIEEAIARLAACLGAAHDELVMTSGATESNNLALFGTCLHPRQKRRKVISLQTEHKALLDPLQRLERQGFEVVLLPVQGGHDERSGQVDLQRLADAIDEHTALVSVMLANNEIGTIQPLAQIASLCRRYEVVLHTDATQAVGRIPVDVDGLDVDLLSFSAHKFYGPKGVGGLFVRRRGRRIKLQAQIVGGGQQYNYRSGTLNTVGIVGMQTALELCMLNNRWPAPPTGDSPLADEAGQRRPDELPPEHEPEAARIATLRDRLFQRLRDIEGLVLNGPAIGGVPPELDAGYEEGRKESRQAGGAGCSRLPGNLNCSFYPVEGQSLMLAVPELAVSSGSACTSAEPSASHVLRAIGLTEEEARSSLRFGLGRYNTPSEVDQAAAWLVAAAAKLRQLI